MSHVVSDQFRSKRSSQAPPDRAPAVRRRSERRRSFLRERRGRRRVAKRDPRAMFAPPICRRSRRKTSRKELISDTIVSSDPTKTAASGEHRSERSELLDTASLASEAIQYSAPDGIRTHAGAGLSRLPLPFGLRGPAMHRPGAILVRLFRLLALSCHRIPSTADKPCTRRPAAAIFSAVSARQELGSQIQRDGSTLGICAAPPSLMRV